MDRETARRYIREQFQPEDRLAVVLLHKQSGEVTQRLASAERIASREFQAWLRHKNARQHEVYISMNTLREAARGRTKADVLHIYLDFDENGTEAANRLLQRDDLPQPNSRISSSPGRWQIVWKVEGFALEDAERLQCWLARDAGADPAATDAVRVLRMPGFYNHKYSQSHLVSVENLSDKAHRPEDFPTPARDTNAASTVQMPRRDLPKSTLSQSERDWASQNGR